MREGMLLANRYRLDRQVGEGGLATVWKGWDNVLERQVAMKILRPELAQDAEVVARFRREAHAAAKLNHPNIVQIFDTGHDEEQDLHFLVMEYLPKPDLKTVITRGAPLPGAGVIQVAIQCCRALAYAHRQGLVHRDVKPHNILFTDEDEAKLSDFGIAAAIGESSLTGRDEVLGSAYYISPEQAQGRPVGPQSDLYSLGCVMFEALTGRPPFTGESAAQIAAQHVHERVPEARELNPNITPGEQYVLEKALARDLNRRYRNAEEMLGDLLKLAAGGELDRTGVIPRSEERTMPLQVVPGAAPAETPGAAVTPPEAAPRPAPVLRPAVPERRDNSVVWYTVIAVIVALAALVATIWLVRPAFYPGVGGRMVQVPALKGHTEADARLRLLEAGLQIGRIEYQADPDSPAGTILEQHPPAGQTVPENTSVDIVVNREPEIVSVPNLVGQDLLEATVRMKELGLEVGTVEQRPSDTVAKGAIITQSIAPGTKVGKPTKVDVVVSAGPEEPPPPPVEPEPEPLAKPRVEVVPDESYQGASPRERRYVLTVTVMGEREGQAIRVVKRDETGGPVVVLDEKLDPPSTTRPKRFIAQGNAVLQVFQNGNQVEEIPLEAPPEPPPAPAGGTGQAGG